MGDVQTGVCHRITARDAESSGQRSSALCVVLHGLGLAGQPGIKIDLTKSPRSADLDGWDFAFLCPSIHRRLFLLQVLCYFPYGQEFLASHLASSLFANSRYALDQSIYAQIDLT